VRFFAGMNPKLACTLLVDDDQTTNYLNKMLIKRLGVTEELLVAQNGLEALNLLKEHCHTEECSVLILLDVKMPVMDGFGFLEAYEQLPEAQKKAVIIVMLTTSLHPQDVERVRQYNIAGFISKPLTEEKVNDIVQNYFSRRQAEG
jgi:CheY-like chemotaxis protein